MHICVLWKRMTNEMLMSLTIFVFNEFLYCWHFHWPKHSIWFFCANSKYVLCSVYWCFRICSSSYIKQLCFNPFLQQFQKSVDSECGFYLREFLHKQVGWMKCENVTDQNSAELQFGKFLMLIFTSLYFLWMIIFDCVSCSFGGPFHRGPHKKKMSQPVRKCKCQEYKIIIIHYEVLTYCIAIHTFNLHN
jgi:hypothetical protein